MLNINKNYKKGFLGFTLIEMMIVVVIISILAAVGYSSYSSHVLKSRRGDAIEAISRAATLQERFFFQRSFYSTDMDQLGGAASGEGYYTVSVTGSDCSGSGTSKKCYGYTLTAAPASGSPQNKDNDCQEFGLDHTSKRTVKANGAVGGNSDVQNCWKR